MICNQATKAQTTPIPRDTSYNLAAVYRQISKDYPYAIPAKDSVSKGVLAERNIIYTSLDNTPYGRRDLRLDIFRPKKQGKYPALLMIHGGGWRSGNKELQVPMAEMLAAKGIVAIPVEYQLSMEAKYPAAVYNIKSAIRWVRMHANEYGIDTSLVAISGCSAGGHLASLAGLTNGVELFEGNQGNSSGSSRINAVIDIDGVIDFMAPGSLNLKRASNSPDIEWLGGSFENKPLIWKEASPIFWANENNRIPMLFLNSGFSRFHAGQDELTGLLKEWNIYFEVQKIDVKVHPFWLFHPWVDTTVESITNFILKVNKV
jgi:pectinesterase